MSWSRLWRKVHRRLRHPPAIARDVLPDYGNYLRLQREEFLSHESEVPRWKCGLERYVTLTFESVSRDARILDCACGDGVAMNALRDLGFLEIVGVELAEAKARRARDLGFHVEMIDMHALKPLSDCTFEFVLSSHTLEHAYEPARVLEEFHRVLVPGGVLHVVLPYPDSGYRNERAHPAKFELGTNVADGGTTVREYFSAHGFNVRSCAFDEQREPEIWLELVRRSHSPNLGMDEPQP